MKSCARDRLDLAAQPLVRVAVDARAAAAARTTARPRASASKRPRSAKPSPSSCASASVRCLESRPSRAQSCRACVGPRVVEVTAHDLAPRRASRSGAALGERRRQRRVGREASRRGNSASIARPLLERAPQRAAGRRDSAGAAPALRRARRTTSCHAAPGRVTTERTISRSCSSSASRGVGQRLVAHALDRVRIERAELARFDRQAAPQRDRARAALLERRVVEERVRAAVQDLVRERRRLGGVAEVHADLARSRCVEQRARARSMSIASCRQSSSVWRTSG